MTRWTPVLVVAAAFAVSCGSALAQQVPLGPYVGASLGEASLKANDSSVDLHFHGDNGSWKVFTGMRLISFLDLEASYADLGSYDDTVSGAKVSTDAKVYNLYAVGSFKLFGILRLFGKAGLTHWDTHTDITGFHKTADSGSDWTWGAGVQVLMLKHLWLRGEYERFNATPKYVTTEPDTRLDLLSAGLMWRF